MSQISQLCLYLCSSNLCILMMLYVEIYYSLKYYPFQEIKGYLSDISNYRGIALSSIFGKALDNVLITVEKEVLSTCDMQFGFKVSHSTTQCIFNVEEIIKYYNNSNWSSF